MSYDPHFDRRNLHSKNEADKAQNLRPPKPETEARLLHGHEGGSSSAAPLSTPKSIALSATAPEFTPKGFQPFQGGPAAYAQPPPGLSVGAAEFIPRNDFLPVPPGVPPSMGPPLQIAPPPFPPSPAGAMPDLFLDQFNQMNLGPGDTGGPLNMEAGDAPLVNEFTRTMRILTTHPANIRDFLMPLCDKLRQAQNLDVVNNVITVLYDQSVYEPNFHNTGARVVHFLCNELKDHPIFGQFKVKFFLKCQQDYQEREHLMKTGEDGLTKLRGLTLFMGELFLNVTANASGHMERLTFLPNVLTDLMLTLLAQPSDNSIKTTCQLLKMAGGPTEDAMAQKTPQELQSFNSIFASLQALQSMPQISQNMKTLMQSVVNLRQRNWERSESRTTNIPENSHENSVAPPDFSSSSEPVFYSPYGKPITREEAGYPEEEDEDPYEAYELTEEEEREFIIWQEENAVHERLAMAPQSHLDNSGAQPAYPEGSVYSQWSTGDPGYVYPEYSPDYDYNGYQPYIEDDGLNDEMEKALEEFLSSQGGPPMG